LQELARIRAQGYAVNDQEVEIGLRSIAVPLVNARGRVVAAINLGLAAASLPAEAIPDRFLPALRRAQAELRGMIG
ncbi:MAG: IclR family transcriptional regulator C-terminal domain-containing protein, partial [Gemmobacter sp.]